jgi:hypothetical protein
VVATGLSDGEQCFRISPLIRGTLISVYLALVLPLPLLAPPGLRVVLLLAAPMGLGLVLAMLSEEVRLSPQGIQVGHPLWCRWLIRRGWQLSWPEIRALVPMGTSQGGTVFYVSTKGQSHYLLPQRIADFDRFLAVFQECSGLNTQGIGRLTPPWTYQLLAVLASLMLAGEMALGLGLQQGWITMPAGVPG